MKLGVVGLIVLACAVVAAVLLSATSATPAAEGTWLAWEEWRGGETKTPDVLAVNLDDADAGPLTFSDKGWEEEPALSEELLLWANDEGGDDDASLIYRRTPPAGEPSPVDQRDEHQHTPAVSGDWVVWLESTDADVEGGSLWTDRLVGYNLTRGERRVLVETVVDVEALSISGERVVWIDERRGGEGRYDVRAYDLGTNKESILQTYVDMPIPGGARVSGSWALWYLDDYDTDTWRVVAYDLINGKLRILPKDATNASDDGWVVCNEGPEVSLLSLASGERRQVASDATDFSYAQVHLPWVAWLELDLGPDSKGSVIRAVNVDTGEQRRFETPENQAEGIRLTITKD